MVGTSNKSAPEVAIDQVWSFDWVFKGWPSTVLSPGADNRRAFTGGLTIELLGFYDDMGYHEMICENLEIKFSGFESP